MTKKNKILLTITAIINFLASLFIIIFATPEKIPVLINNYEKITFTSTKWLMLILAILPVVLLIFNLKTKNQKIRFILVSAFLFLIFENTMLTINNCFSTKLNIGDTLDVPLSVLIFMPMSMLITILSIKLKNTPFKSKFGLNFNVTRQTSFIWTQTHFFASTAYFIMSLILFFTSFIFCFVRFILIELAIFALVISIFTIIIYNYSFSCFVKYYEMKLRRDVLNKKRDVPKGCTCGDDDTCKVDNSQKSNDEKLSETIENINKNFEEKKKSYTSKTENNANNSSKEQTKTDNLVNDKTHSSKTKINANIDKNSEKTGEFDEIDIENLTKLEIKAIKKIKKLKKKKSKKIDDSKLM